MTGRLVRVLRSLSTINIVLATSSNSISQGSLHLIRDLSYNLIRGAPRAELEYFQFKYFPELGSVTTGWKYDSFIRVTLALSRVRREIFSDPPQLIMNRSIVREGLEELSHRQQIFTFGNNTP